jgi:hypothetical protein
MDRQAEEEGPEGAPPQAERLGRGRDRALDGERSIGAHGAT